MALLILTVRPACRTALALCVTLLAGCASSPPQGYGVTAPPPAAQARQQAEQAAPAAGADQPATYLDLIRQMQQARQWYASLAHTEAFEREYGPTPRSRLMRADALRHTGQGAEAEQIYQALLAERDGPTAARAHRGLGLLYASQGRLPQAVAQLEQARRLQPVDADVLSDLAYAHMLDGDLAAARLPVKQAAQLAPGNARVQLNLALYWLASGEEAQARELLNRLGRPQGRNAPPLIDAQSLQTLQAQLATVTQAVQARAAAASVVPVRSIVIGPAPLRSRTAAAHFEPDPDPSPAHRPAAQP